MSISTINCHQVKKKTYTEYTEYFFSLVQNTLLKMKIILFILVTLISSSLGMKCWNVKLNKPCMGSGKKVDTKKCGKDECKGKNTMCKRETIESGGKTMTTLHGCSSGTEETTTCYCKKNLCNEATGKRASIIVWTLFICMLLIQKRNEI